MESSSWENFHLHMEFDCGDDYLIDDCQNVNTDGDDFLREILLQTPQGTLISSENESDYSLQVQNGTVNVNGDAEVVGNMVKSNSSNSIESQKEQEHGMKSKKIVPRRCSSPKTYILSFDNSTIIPATPESNFEGKRDSGLGSNKRNRENLNGEVKINRNNEGKKVRSGSQTVDHIMAERKRRQELTERFIALSATIPGLSKTDKASVLRAAIDYVKQLQERVQVLEKQDKNVNATSLMLLNKQNLCGINNKNNNEDTICGETSCYDYSNNILPEIEARIMGKEVLIEIHCEKQIGIELKLLSHIENLQLFVTGSSVLPFGNSAISVTIIAQMCEGYNVTVNDLVKSLRQLLLKPHMASQSDPY